MPRSREISQDLRKKVIEAHQSGKGYKRIATGLGLSRSTVRSILHKWKKFGTVVTLPRSGRPPKISPRARRKIIREVMKDPCMTSKDLQATLSSADIHVHPSTIKRLLVIHRRPTLSSLQDSMASSQNDGIQEVSDEFCKTPDELDKVVMGKGDQQEPDEYGSCRDGSASAKVEENFNENGLYSNVCENTDDSNESGDGASDGINENYVGGGDAAIESDHKDYGSDVISQYSDDHS